MFEGRFGSLPVMEQGKLVGIVTECDVLKALAQTLPPCGASIQTHIFGDGTWEATSPAVFRFRKLRR